jgi:serine/threonine protein phosphatase PrpC
MQGWRKTMEDSHIAKLDVVDQEVSIFAVFDGHGGCEVAYYVENHFIEELRKSEAFKKGDYKNALIDTFLLLDKQLLTDAGKRELL